MKELVARALAQRVKDGDLMGLGSGSTAELTLIEIGKRIKNEGITVNGIPTSHRCAILAAEAGIKVLDAATVSQLDWAFDGADEVDENFRMIKGNGAAMLSEKITAKKAKQFVVVVTEDKMVSVLGSKFPVPIEVIPEAVLLVQSALPELGAVKLEVRKAVKKYGPVITEHGNVIIDANFKSISDTLEKDINCLTGVVDNGIFTGFNPELLIAKEKGVFSRRRVSGEMQEKLVFAA